MRMSTRSSVVTALGLCLLVACVGRDADAQEIPGLLDAVAFYHEHATSDLKRIHEATKRFEAVTIDHPPAPDRADSWLPAYWTAFAYTQLSLFADDDRGAPYVSLARHYFDEASAVKPEGDAEVDADFFALEGLILSFVRRTTPDDPAAGGEREAWNRARAADPNNPMMLMNGGLALIANAATREQAYELLDRAIELYEPRLGTVRPNWGREFIDVWMGSYPRGDGS